MSIVYSLLFGKQLVVCAIVRDTRVKSMHTFFGTQLRKERNKQKLTVETVAKACGISRSYVTLMETGLRLPGKKNIAKIAKALHLKTGTVLNWYLEDITRVIKKY